MGRNRRLSRKQARSMNNQGGYDKSLLYKQVCSVYTIITGTGADAIEMSVDNISQYLTGNNTVFRLNPDKGAHTDNGQMPYRLISLDGKEITSKDTGVTARMAQSTSVDIVVGVPFPNDKKLRVIRLYEEAEGNEDNTINFIVTMKGTDINPDQSPDEIRLTLEDFTTLHNEDYSFTFTTDFATPGFVEGTGVSGTITEADRRRDKGVAYIRYESDRLTLMNSLIVRGKINRGSPNIADYFTQKLNIEWEEDDIDGIPIKDKFLKMNICEMGIEVLSTSIVWKSFWPNEYDWLIRRIGSGCRNDGQEASLADVQTGMQEAVQCELDSDISDSTGWTAKEGTELNSTPSYTQAGDFANGILRQLYRTDVSTYESEGTTKISFASLDFTSLDWISRGNIVYSLNNRSSVNRTDGLIQFGNDTGDNSSPNTANYTRWTKQQLHYDRDKGLYDILCGHLTWWYPAAIGLFSRYNNHYNVLGLIRNEYFTSQEYYEDYYNPSDGNFRYQGQQFMIFDEDEDVTSTNKNTKTRDLTGIRADNNENDRKYLVQIPMGEFLTEGTTLVEWEFDRHSSNSSNRLESSYIKRHNNTISRTLYDNDVFVKGGTTSNIPTTQLQKNNYPIDLIFKFDQNIRIDGDIEWDDGIEITRIDMNAYCRGNHKITYYDVDKKVLRVDTIRSASVTDARRIKTTKIYESEIT